MLWVSSMHSVGVLKSIPRSARLRLNGCEKNVVQNSLPAGFRGITPLPMPCSVNHAGSSGSSLGLGYPNLHVSLPTQVILCSETLLIYQICTCMYDISWSFILVYNNWSGTQRKMLLHTARLVRRSRTFIEKNAVMLAPKSCESKQNWLSYDFFENTYSGHGDGDDPM